MAVPTIPRRATEQRSLASNMLIRIRRLLQSIWRPLFAVVLGLVGGGIIILLSSGSVFDAYNALFGGAFGDLPSFSTTLTKTTPLIFASLSVAIAFRAGLFNIGTAGQMAVGAMVAGIIGLKASTWPGWILVPTMIIASMLAGGVWGGIVGFLKAWRGSHEVVTTIMLNWIAFFVADYLIDGPFTAPGGSNQTAALPPQATLPSVAGFYNQTLGTFLPPIPQPDQYLVDVSIFFALIAVVVYWFIVSRTTFGYEIRVIGQNPQAARYAGIPIKRNIFLVMALAGAFGGLAGSLRLMGQFPNTLIATTFSVDSTGFDAIAAALLGQISPIGILFGSLFFGGLRAGSPNIQATGVSGDIVSIIEALVLFCMAAEFLPMIQRNISGWMSFSRKPSLVAPTIGTSLVDLPENGNAASKADTEAPVTTISEEE